MTLALACCLVAWCQAAAERPQEVQRTEAGATTKAMGTVKAVGGNIITLSTDTGSNLSITILDSTRMVRIAPGQKDLKDAVLIQLSDVQVQDRILARGAPSADGKSIAATSLVLMKQADLTAKQAREREDWQERGVGGLVSEVDAAAGIIRLSQSGLGASTPVTIHTSKETIVRRYSPDSVKFDDARPGVLGDIKVGDQVRARGSRSADGAEMTAEEVVSGTFRNIAGTVLSIDASTNTLSLMDLATRKPVVVKITPDSQLRKLPALVAQRVAMRLRGETPGGAPGTPAGGGFSAAQKSADGARNPNGGLRSGGAPDFQQMLKRMPAVALADLQKGDALMILTTQRTSTTQPTVITLLSGVEPILSASPSGNRAAMLLSPWNLGGGGGDAAAGP